MPFGLCAHTVVAPSIKTTRTASARLEKFEAVFIETAIGRRIISDAANGEREQVDRQQDHDRVEAATHPAVYSYP